MILFGEIGAFGGSIIYQFAKDGFIKVETILFELLGALFNSFLLIINIQLKVVVIIRMIIIVDTRRQLYIIFRIYICTMMNYATVL